MFLRWVPLSTVCLLANFVSVRPYTLTAGNTVINTPHIYKSTVAEEKNDNFLFVVSRGKNDTNKIWHSQR